MEPTLRNGKKSVIHYPPNALSEAESASRGRESRIS